MMARAPPKKAAKAAKAAPVKRGAPKAPKAVKKAAPKKAAPKRTGGKSPEGKGGIFPWITNEPGSTSLGTRTAFAPTGVFALAPTQPCRHDPGVDLCCASRASLIASPVRPARPYLCAAYAKVLKLSEVDFTGDDSDSFIGWGFMPKSVKALYNTNKKGLL
jgi:hypothetical protein